MPVYSRFWMRQNHRHMQRWTKAQLRNIRVAPKCNARTDMRATTKTYLRIKLPRNLTVMREPDAPTSSPVPSTTSLFPSFFLFFSWPVFLPDSAPFSRARRCYRGTNSLFCRIASDFKVCLPRTLGRARTGTEHVSHTET